MKAITERIRHIVARAEQHGIVIPDMQFGAVIAVAEPVDCLRVIERISLKIEKRVAAVLENDLKVMGNELEFGDYTSGRYAWILSNVRQIEPVQAKGMQRLWEWEMKTPST